MRCQRRILHNRWHDYIPNNDSSASHWSVGNFFHRSQTTSRTVRSCCQACDDVPANRILRTCCEAHGVRPCSDWRRARGRPPTTWTQQICQDSYGDRRPAAGRRPIVLVTNRIRNGGKLRLNASRAGRKEGLNVWTYIALIRLK